MRLVVVCCFFFQAEDGIRDLVRSRGLGDVYKRQIDSYVEGINPGNNLPVGNSPRSFSAWIKNYQYNQWGSNIFHYGTAQPAPTNFHFLLTDVLGLGNGCLLYTSPSPRDRTRSRMPSSA